MMEPNTLEHLHGLIHDIEQEIRSENRDRDKRLNQLELDVQSIAQTLSGKDGKGGVENDVHEIKELIKKLTWKIAIAVGIIMGLTIKLADIIHTHFPFWFE